MHTDPGKDEPILVVNPDETAGTLLVVKGDEPDPISIKLEPAGTVTGRLVDDNGPASSERSLRRHARPQDNAWRAFSRRAADWPRRTVPDQWARRGRFL